MSPADLVRRIVLSPKNTKNSGYRQVSERFRAHKCAIRLLSGQKSFRGGEGFSGGEEGSAIAVERARNHSFSINTVQNYLGVVSIVFRICFKFKSFSLKNKIMQNFYSIISKKECKRANGEDLRKEKNRIFHRHGYRLPKGHEKIRNRGGGYL